MANTLKNHPSFPSNYVTILDLKERWLKQQQQQQQEAETETTNKKSDIAVDAENSVEMTPQFRKPKPKFSRNPNRVDRKKMPTLQYWAVKASNSAQETPEIQDEAEIGAENDDRDDVKKSMKKKKRKKKKRNGKKTVNDDEMEAKLKEVVLVAQEGAHDNVVQAKQTKVKEVCVAEKGAHGIVVQEKQNLATVSKQKQKKGKEKEKEKEVFATRNRNVRRGRSETRANSGGGEGNRNTGFIWVKKGETSGKTSGKFHNS
ncbi:hypothetical protein vseg_012486 [Gypsophila vaccaria]